MWETSINCFHYEINKYGTKKILKREGKGLSMKKKLPVKKAIRKKRGSSETKKTEIVI
jgi:hypothetical protein